MNCIGYKKTGKGKIMEVLKEVKAISKDSFKLIMESGSEKHYTLNDNDNIKNYCKRHNIEYRYYYHDYIWKNKGNIS